MSAAAQGGGGGGAAPPPEPCGASGGEQWPTGRIAATGASRADDGGGPAIDLSTSSTETEVDTSATETAEEEEEETNATTGNTNAGGKRRRGGVGVRRRPAQAQPVAAASAVDNTRSNSNHNAALPRAVEPPAPVGGSNLLAPFDVDAMVFGPGGPHHDPEADERERQRRRHRARQQQGASESAAAAGDSRPAVAAASKDDGSANTNENKTGVVGMGGRSSQGVVASADLGTDSKKSTAGGVSTLAVEASGQTTKKTSASISSSAAASSDGRTNSEAAASSNSKPAASMKDSSVAGSGSADDEEKKSDGDDAATPSVTPKSKRMPKESMNSVLRKRKAGTEHDQEAIDTCSTFIETQLMTKTCTNRINNLYSTQCTCIKTLDPALVRPAATYAATTWFRKSDDAKVDQILKWNLEKAGFVRPYQLPSIQSGDSAVEKQVCRNGLGEVLGITTALWTKVLRAERCEKGDEESILNEASAFIDADGSEAVDACANFIESYLMKKNCTDRAKFACTSCTCIKTLDPALVRPAAAFISSNWGKMEQKEKVDHLVLLISNQSDDALPFELPIETDPINTSQPSGTKMICRNALIELLCIPKALWEEANGRVVGAVQASATGLSQHVLQLAFPCDSSVVQPPAVNPIMFGPMAGNPTMWAQFHAQAQASATKPTVEQPREVVVETSSSTGGQGEADSASSRPAVPPAGSAFDNFASGGGAPGRRGETPAARVPRQEAQPESGERGKKSAIIPVQGADAMAAESTSAPNHPSNLSGDGKKYVCDKCHVAEFTTYDEACKHESTCAGATPQGEKSVIMAFTPRPATDEEISADTNATIEPTVLTNIAALCKQERWEDVTNLIFTNPSLAAATFATEGNHMKTSILHQVISSGGDIHGRAGLLRSILSARPSAASIKNSYGSLPIHMLAQRKCKMKANVKEELLRGLIHAYPASLSIAGGTIERTPLHLLFTDYFGADVCRLMLTLGPESVKMRDKNGWLPIHVASSRHCSLECLRMLLNAYPDSIHKTTNDGKTPLMLARSTATKGHPNNNLIQELTKQLQANADTSSGNLDPDLVKDTKSPANRVSSPCEATAAEALLAVSATPKRKTSAESLPTAEETTAGKLPEDEKNKLAKEEYVPSDQFFFGQHVWVSMSGQTEHAAMVVSRGKADTTEITVRWSTAGFDQTVDIRQVRAMYSDSSPAKPEGATLTSSSPARRRSTPRPSGTHQCGNCDACMVDDCGECKYCLDRPRFGGERKSKKKCLNRPVCTVRGSSAKASKTTPTTQRGTSKSVASASKSEYKPPGIRIGMEVMKYFADEDGGSKRYFEGTLRRTPTPSSPHYLIVYSDGDKEEISEDDFWAAYSDYRVQKNLIEPSEFVPDSLVVANNGRLGEVLSFRPVSNETDTTWSYRVHFTGLPASCDKWMVEVDLRKQTPSTLRWAEKVRAAVRAAANKSPGSVKRPASTSSGTKQPIAKQTPPSSARPKASRKAPQVAEGRSYSPRRAGTSIDSAQRPAKRAKASSSASSNDATASDVVRHSRRAAAADARAVMSKTGGPKRLKKEKSPPKANNDTLPDIAVGTNILKYFAEGKQYYQGKITRLPGRGNGFYHVRYDDGDDEDMAPDEMWMAFSDWCVANDEISLTQFEPNQQVYAVDCLGVPREAEIKSFRPVEKQGSDEWSWSYLVHYVGWNSRHNDWIDEINIYKVTPANKKWAEEIQAEVERRRQRESSQPKPSSCSSAPTNTPGSSRKRERRVNDETSSAKQEKKWQCDRCDLLNESYRTRCSGCQGWKGGKAPRTSKSQKDGPSPWNLCIVDGCDRYKQAHCNSMCCTHYRESLTSDSTGSDRGQDAACGPSPIMKCSVDGCDKWKRSNSDGMCRSHCSESLKQKESVGDEDSVVSEESDDGWSCPLCQKQNGPESLTCSDACGGVRRCLVLGCTEACQKDCDGMCTSHYQEALNACEANDSEDEDENGNSDAAIETDGTTNSIPVASSNNTTDNVEMTSAAAGSIDSGASSPPADEEGPGSDDSNSARDIDDANTSSKTNTSGDAKVAAEGVVAPVGVAASSSNSVRSPGESDAPNDGAEHLSSPQPAAAAATAPVRHTEKTPNLQNVMAALREADSDDDDDDGDGDFEEVFGYFGASL